MTIHSTHPLACFCGRKFTSAIDLEEHRRARGHFASHICGGLCKHPPIPNFEFQVRKCGQCGKVCEHSGILEDHRIATGHSFFANCNLPQEVQQTQATEQKLKAHASEFRCCDCDLFFLDIHALEAHVRKHSHVNLPQKKTIQQSIKVDKTASVVNSSKVCEKCKKTFSSTQALQQHCDSIKHKPLSALACPMSSQCTGRFTAPSALLHHLESGNCLSGIDRDDIYHQIQLQDREQRIHNLPTLTPSSSAASPIFSHTPPLETPIEMSVEWSLALTGLSGNIVQDSPSPTEGANVNGISLGLTLQCPLCPKSRKKFATKQALQQHMESPAHGDKLYHCPINTDRISAGQAKKQRKEFTTLAGLAQHLESGACDGGKSTFLYYVDLIQQQMDRWGFGGVRLVLPSSTAQ